MPRPRARRGIGALVLCLVLLQAACYRYRVAAYPAVGTDVRVELTTEGTSALTGALGPRVTGIDGRLLRFGTDSSLVLHVLGVRKADGSREEWAGEMPVEVRRTHLHAVAVRELDRARSWTVGAVIAAAAATVGILAVEASRGKDGTGGSPPPPPPP